MTDRHSIITLPDERLRTKSTKVDPTSESTKDLTRDMEIATLDWEESREHELAVALAAVQIGRLDKVVVIRNNMDDKDDKTFVVLVNPKIIQKSKEMATDFEGCLSIRDLYGKVTRHLKVKVVAQDLEGREFRINAEGFLARVLQHEIDHTNGVVFIDHTREQGGEFYNLGSDGNMEKLDYDKHVKDSDILW